MPIENVPESYFDNHLKSRDLFVYDFKMTDDAVKTKVNLSMHMLSFLQVGKKQVHYGGNTIAVNKHQSLLLKKGNALWTEILDQESIYYCKLFFFSESKLIQFLRKHKTRTYAHSDEPPFFIIKNDEYILAFVKTLSAIISSSTASNEEMLAVKFEEILLYLMDKYGQKFEKYLQSLIAEESSQFKTVIENYVYSNLKLEEIAFLCNMSLSTFKRHFIQEFGESPGKWLQDKRLQKAKEKLASGELKPSDIYMDYGYNNLSNFSTAFKNKFGLSPKQMKG